MLREEFRMSVKIDDPTSPINAAFKGRSFNTIDEVYTFSLLV